MAHLTPTIPKHVSQHPSFMPSFSPLDPVPPPPASGVALTVVASVVTTLSAHVLRSV